MLAPKEAAGIRCFCWVYKNLPVVKNQLVFLLGLD
jgi:hypothetical protein